MKLSVQFSDGYFEGFQISFSIIFETISSKEEKDMP